MTIIDNDVEEDEPIMQTPVKHAPKDMSTSPEILSKLRIDAKTEQRRESKTELTATAVFTQPELSVLPKDNIQTLINKLTVDKEVNSVEPDTAANLVSTLTEPPALARPLFNE